MLEPTEIEVPPQTRPNEAFIVLTAGSSDAAVHLWVRTCDDPECDCRLALIVAHENEQHLRETVASRSHTWQSGKTSAEDFAGMTAFELDFDWRDLYVPLQLHEGMPLECRDENALRILSRLTEAAFDEIAMNWWRGKGLTPPPAESKDLELLSDWKPGAKVEWSEAYGLLREDAYRREGSRYLAYEHYCVKPDCGCGEVTLVFVAVTRQEARVVGDLVVELAGRTRIERSEAEGQLVATLFELYKARHADYRGRMQARAKKMTEFGPRLFAWYHERTRPKWRPTSRKGRKRQGVGSD